MFTASIGAQSGGQQRQHHIAALRLRGTFVTERRAVYGREMQFSVGWPCRHRSQLQQNDEHRACDADYALHATVPLRDRCHAAIAQKPQINREFSSL